jgi:hypothetical protein
LFPVLFYFDDFLNTLEFDIKIFWFFNLNGNFQWFRWEAFRHIFVPVPSNPLLYFYFYLLFTKQDTLKTFKNPALSKLINI